MTRYEETQREREKEKTKELQERIKSEEEKKDNLFSFYNKPIGNTKPNKEIGIKEFIEIIRSDKYKGVCGEIREIQITEKKNKEEVKKERDKIKSIKLDYVTIAGIFNERAILKIKEPSGLMCIDIDGLTPEEAKEKKDFLKNNDFVNAIFISPSNEGLKVVVKIPKKKENEEYKEYYKSFAEMTGGEIDGGACDISRACFMSYDPEAYININSEEWKEKTTRETPGQTTIKKDKSRSGKEWGELLKLINKGKKSAEGIDKDYIFNEMNFYSKWKEGTEAYREHTYKKGIETTETKKEEKK